MVVGSECLEEGLLLDAGECGVHGCGVLLALLLVLAAEFLLRPPSAEEGVVGHQSEVQSEVLQQFVEVGRFRLRPLARVAERGGGARRVRLGEVFEQVREGFGEGEFGVAVGVGGAFQLRVLTVLSHGYYYAFNNPTTASTLHRVIDSIGIIWWIPSWALAEALSMACWGQPRISRSCRKPSWTLW